jgi:hypothetical protein
MNLKKEDFFFFFFFDAYVKSVKANIFCCQKANDEMGALSLRKLLLAGPTILQG